MTPSKSSVSCMAGAILCRSLRAFPTRSDGVTRKVAPTEFSLTDYATALHQWLAGTDASGERAVARTSARAGFVTRGPAQRAALERVRAWTRERFALGDDVTLLVTEL